MKPAVQHAIRLTAGYIRDIVEPIDDAKYARMPLAPDGKPLNPPAWLVPHIAFPLSILVEMLGATSPFPEAWKPAVRRGSTPTDDASAYPTKREALDVLDGVVAALIDALDDATDEQLAAENPIEPMRGRAPTVGDAIVFFGITHTSLHLGQLLSWRRCMGFESRF